MTTSVASVKTLRAACLAGTAIAVALLYVVLAHPPMAAWPFENTSMLSVHLLLELVAVLVALLIVTVGWHAFEDTSAGSVMACGFLVVASCDLVHSLTYAGMPALLGEASTSRAIFFWLAGRSAEVLTLGVLAVNVQIHLPRRAMIAIGFALSALLVGLGSWTIDSFPTTFVKGQGVTPFKAGYEYVLCAMNVAVGVLLWRRAVVLTRRHYYLLATSAFVMAAGELSFTNYVSPSDFQNVFGHLYKVVAYVLLYQAAFLTSIRAPYDALRVAEERLKLATHAAAIGIWDWDVVRDVLVWNEEMHCLYGIAPAQFGGRRTDWARALSPEDTRRAQAMLDAAVQGEREFVAEFVIVRPDGSRRIVRGEAVAMRDGAGPAQRLVGVNVDVTEARRAEEEIRLLNADLERRVSDRTARLERAMRELGRARDAAESATQAKSEFLANMSHEIRTPMNAVLGLTDLMLRTATDARQSDLLLKSQMAANTLLELVEQVLDFSKIEAGKLELEAREFELDQVLDRMAVIVGEKARQKGIAILFQVAPTVPECLVGDSQRLAQILINLCSNAVKFTAAGEIVVSIRQLAVSTERCTLQVSVCDNGIGMTPEQAGRLFRPFTQAESSTSRRFGGTGLGLAISKQLVSLMQGEIGVHSEPGVGSEFWFTAAFGLPATAEAVRGAAPALHELRVLVVDSSDAACKAYVQALARWGCDGVVVRSAGEALAALSSDASGCDVVVLDYPMSDADTFDVARRVAALAIAGTPPPCLVATALGDEETANRVRNAGLGECLLKPFTPTSLRAALLATSGHASAHAARAPRDDPRVIGSVRDRHVLLVDDNELNQLVAGELLREVAGMRVSVACDGQQALDLLRDERFDAILMDVQMPGMDGYEATRRIRARPGLSTLPVIAMTANASAGDREECLACGMNDFIAKPFEPAALFAVLARWIERPPEAPAAAQAAQATDNGVSFERGLSLCLGKAELYERVIRRFVETNGHVPREIESALSAGDHANVIAHAHRLVSSAGVIGATTLSELARTLQHAVESGHTDSWDSLASALTREHAFVHESLERHLADRP